MKTTIEVGGTAPASDIGAAQLKQMKAARDAKAPVIAKQRTEKRAKGRSNVHDIDRSLGASVKQQAARAHQVEAADPATERSWRRPYSLPSFPDPPGFVFCYIARHKRRHGDDAGLLSSLREGWVPVKPEELDEEDLPVETFTGRLAKWGEVIGDETTVLMKLPERFKAQRDAYYNSKRDSATRAVTRKNPGLDIAHPSMPLVEDKNQLSIETPRMRARRPSASSEAPAE